MHAPSDLVPFDIQLAFCARINYTQHVIDFESFNCITGSFFLLCQYTDPASYVAMMRDQAAKRSRMSGDRCNKSRHKLPDLLPKRPASHDLSHRRNEDGFQSALIKAVL